MARRPKRRSLKTPRRAIRSSVLVERIGPLQGPHCSTTRSACSRRETEAGAAHRAERRANTDAESPRRSVPSGASVRTCHLIGAARPSAGTSAGSDSIHEAATNALSHTAPLRCNPAHRSRCQRGAARCTCRPRARGRGSGARTGRRLHRHAGLPTLRAWR